MKVTNNLNEIRAKSTMDLQTKCQELKEELFNLKFQLSLKQLTNTVKIREVRRNIARIKAVLTERELANREG